MNGEIDNIHRDLIITKEHMCDLENATSQISHRIDKLTKIFCIISLLLWRIMYL